MSWKMWENWELFAATPKINDINSNGYLEPLYEDLVEMINKIPLQKDFKIGVEPFILPISLQ